MDAIIMNIILVSAVLSLGYYILDAFVSLFVSESRSAVKNKHKKNSSRNFTLEESKANRRIDKSFKRVVNS